MGGEQVWQNMLLSYVSVYYRAYHTVPTAWYFVATTVLIVYQVHDIMHRALLAAFSALPL